MPDINPSPWEEFPIADFSGGLCTAFPEDRIRDNQFRGLLNYYVDDDGSLKTREPFRPYLYGSASTVFATAPLAFMFAEMEGTDYVLAYRSGVLEYWNSGWTDVAEGSALSGSNVDLIKYSLNDKDDIIICDGVATPQRWNKAAPTATTDLGLDVPTAAVITAATAADGGTGATGVGTTGTYYYKLTYFYESSTTTQYGESNPSATTFNVAMTVTANRYHAIDISALPTFPTGVTRIYIYRSQVNNENGIYRRVGYITSGTTFTDNTNEGEEGIELPIDDGDVPTLKYPYAINGRIFGVGALNNKLVWTPKGQPDIFPALNYAYFPDPITGITSFRDNLYVFTEKQGFRILNADPDTNDPLKISNRGCTARKSLVDVGSGLVWQGEDNVYWADFNIYNDRFGDYPFPIGNPIKDKIMDIYAGQWQNSAACYWDGKYILSYTSSSSTANDTTLCWNTRKARQGQEFLTEGGAWSQLDWAANYLQSYSTAAGDREKLYSADNTRKYIMEHGFAAAAGKDYYAYGGAAQNIPTSIQSKRFHFSHPMAHKILGNFTVGCKTSGVTYTLGVDIVGDNTTYRRTQSYVLASGTAASRAAAARYGTAIYGTSTYASDPFGFASVRHKIPKSKGKNFVFSLNSPNTQDTVLSFITIQHKQLPVTL
jgi:hypothetical protein